MKDLGGDARRDNQPGGQAQCALAAVRNVTEDGSLTNQTLLNDKLAGCDQIVNPRWRGTTDAHGLVLIEDTSQPRYIPDPEQILRAFTTLPWRKILKKKCLKQVTQTVIGIQYTRARELTREHMGDIERAVIQEDMGGGPTSHATAIIACNGNQKGKKWHYFNNETRKWPAPRPEHASTISYEEIIDKIHTGRGTLWAVVEGDSPLAVKEKNIGTNNRTTA